MSPRPFSFHSFVSGLNRKSLHRCLNRISSSSSPVLVSTSCSFTKGLKSTCGSYSSGFSPPAPSSSPPSAAAVVGACDWPKPNKGFGWPAVTPKPVKPPLKPVGCVLVARSAKLAPGLDPNIEAASGFGDLIN